MNRLAEALYRHRLLATAGLAGLLVLVVAGLTGSHGHPTAPGYPQPGPTSTVTATPWIPATTRPAPSTEPATPTPTTTATATASQAHTELAAQVAYRFTQAFQATGYGKDRWLTGLVGYVTAGLYSGLQVTDPANLPDPAVRPLPGPTVLEAGPALVRVRVSLNDHSAVMVDVIDDPRHDYDLRVSAVVPADQE